MPKAEGPKETLVIDDPSLPVVGCDPHRVEETFFPVRDRYLVRLDPAMDRSKGGILVPDQSRPASRTGVIVRAGPGAISEDGKTLLPMHAKIGQRIMFEYNAGYSIPRVPEDKYKVIRDGSIIGTIDDGPPGSVWPMFEEDAERVVPRVRVIQDWVIVRMDRPSDRKEIEPPKSNLRIARTLTPSEMVKHGKKLHGKGTPMALEIPETARALQAERGDHWTGVVVSRGPGLMSVVRCLDGDRITIADPLCKVGDRIGVTNEFPFFSIPAVNGYAIVRDSLCMTGVFK